MPLERHLFAYFSGHQDAHQHMVDALAEPLIDAADLLVQALLSEHRILCAGNGAGSALAQLFVSQLLGQLERPALPALCLAGDITSFSALSCDGHANEVYAAHLQALGQPGDVLVAISDSGRCANLMRAVQAAHERDITVILLSAGEDRDISALLTPGDIALHLRAPRRGHVHECQLTVLNALCALVEQQLFAGAE